MEKLNLAGLVLVGGKSHRMGQDKAKIKYGGKEQAAVAFDLLQKFCSQVFLSVRDDQKNDSLYRKYPQIHDQAPYQNSGPLGGILSAFTKHPDTAWMVLGCDLPFVDESTLGFLVSHRDPQKMATAYRSAHDDLPEPLCAIYEKSAFSQMKDFYVQGIHCPRKILINSDVCLLIQPAPAVLDNVNTPQELAKAQQKLQK